MDERSPRHGRVFPVPASSQGLISATGHRPPSANPHNDSKYIDTIMANILVPPVDDTNASNDSYMHSYSNSYYSQESHKDATTCRVPVADVDANADAASHAAYLRGVFCRLCQVGLRLAELRHARTTARQAARQAKAEADRLAQDLLREHLASCDALYCHHLKAIFTALDAAALSPTSPTETPSSPLLRQLYTTAERARKLQTQLHGLDAQVAVEQQSLLWPSLEQWRIAVDEYRRTAVVREQSQKQGNEEATATAGTTQNGRQDAGGDGGDDNVNDDDNPAALDLLQQHIQQELLPRLDRRRLRQLWDHVGQVIMPDSTIWQRQGLGPLQVFI